MIVRRKRTQEGTLNPLLLLTGTYIAILSIFGGGNTVFGLTTLLLLLTTTLFVAGLLVLHPALPPIPLGLKIGLVLIAALPLLQILPLPPGLWQSLPGSALRLDVLSLIGKAGNWQPLSLEPIYTAQNFVLAAGFVALVLGLLALDAPSFRHVMQGLLGLIALGILVGVVQVATRGLFPSFFTHADTGSLIGFYSNKNHMALAIAASLSLARIILASDRQKHPIQYLLFFAYWAVALIAILATTSRAGVALGMLASLLIALSMLRRVRPSHRLAIAGAVIVCAALVATSAPFHKIMDRFDYIDDDSRWLFTLRSLPLVRHYWLFGAGGGVFSDLFITYEPIEWVKPTIMNHVHDDYIELVIEYGVPGVLALLASGIGIVQAALAIPDRANRAAVAVRLAGLLIIALVALHSIVDYPLRRPAMLAILAVAIAMVVRPVAPTMHRPEKSRRHHGTLAGR